MKIQAPRRGIALVAVIACLILMIGVFGVLIRQGLLEKKQVRAEERSLAVEWLAQSGLELAKARLDADASYTGETWQIPPDEMESRDPASVRIEVAAVPEFPHRREVRVWANHPVDGPNRARKSLIALIDVFPGENR